MGAKLTQLTNKKMIRVNNCSKTPAENRIRHEVE